MNERYKELAREAGLLVHNPKNMPTKLEKFAQLLIQDCLNIVEELPPGYRDYRDQIEDAFRRDCIESIKERFGVKE
jgi:hypothetical protein